MKYICAMTALALLLCFAGCGQPQDNDGPAFYYLLQEPSYDNGSIIAPEQRSSLDQGSSLEYLLAHYLNGPESDHLSSPFPKGTAIDDMTWDGNILQLSMNGVFSALSGIDLTKASACLAMTVFSGTDAELVRLTYTDSLTGTNKCMELSRDSLVLQDTLTPAS